MPILVTCTCGKKFRADEKHAGKQKSCPKCGQSLDIAGPHVSAYDVFVSYSSKDKTTCDALVATFERKGMRCWIAPRDILPGANWGEAIIRGIEQCRTMVLVFSAHSNESPQVKREVERAVSKGIPVIPLRIEDVKLSHAMEYFISSQHWLDALTPPLESHLEELARKVMRLLSDDGSSVSAPGRSGPEPIPKAVPISEWTAPAPDPFSLEHLSSGPVWPASPAVNDPSPRGPNYLLPRPSPGTTWTRIPLVWRWVAVGGTAALFVLLIFNFLRPSGVGTIKIDIPGSYTNLTVKIDGQSMDDSQLSNPLSLKVGEHRLEVAGQDIEPENKTFKVNKGENPELQIMLVSKPHPAESGAAAAKTRTSEPNSTDNLIVKNPPIEKQLARSKTPDETTPAPKSETTTSSHFAENDAWVWADPIHVGRNVDTEEFEWGMTCTPDELTMFFGRLSSATKNRDIWKSSRPSRDKPYEPAEKLPSDINTASDEGSPTFTADGLTLFFDSTRPSGAGGWDIWMAQRASLNEPFGTAKSLGQPINTAVKDSAPTVTGDGLLLLFQSDRPGKKGQVSIWMSSRTSDNASFSKPVVLGPNINAGGWDFDPAISSDGRALIFVSNRSGGVGGDDLWMSIRASRDAAFGPAVNLGPKINTAASEYKPSLSIDGRTLYFGSPRGGEGELWYAKRQLPSSENNGVVASGSEPPSPAANRSVVPPDAIAFQGHSYKYFGERRSWKEAKLRCAQMGGHLPIVELAAENKFLTKLANQNFPQSVGERLDAIWLGASDEVKEGEWRWEDGTRVSFSNWASGQPNNKQEKEHYAVLWPAGDSKLENGIWADQSNVATQHVAYFICEWDGDATSAPAGNDWIDLFNGTDQTGWKPVASAGAWSVPNGILTATPGDGWLATDRDYGDFELELEYKIPPNGNSGVFLRAPLNGASSGAGLLEIQAIDDMAFRNEPDHNRTGAVWGLFGGKPRADAPTNKWNKLSIRAVGPRITVVVNGTKVTEGNLADEPEAALKPNMKLPAGRIGLQRRGATKVEFRNIRIRELNENE